MRYTVNVNDIESALISLGGEARAKEIQDKILSSNCRNEIPDNYQHEKSFRQTIQRKMEDYCPQAKGYDSTKKDGKFLRVGHGLYRLGIGSQLKEFPALEEIVNPGTFSEGATKTIAVNAYERSQLARKLCIEYYGWSCVACGFNFEVKYGEVGKAFVHVHHLKSLSEIGKNYKVDPIADLRPVCANCHAIIHRVAPPLSIRKLKTILDEMERSHG